MCRRFKPVHHHIQIKAFRNESLFCFQELTMYHVYILKSLKSGIHYVGMAKDVSQRLKEHNGGKSKFTKGHMPRKLIYSEGPFETKTARQKEKYYKTTSGKEFLRKNGSLD